MKKWLDEEYGFDIEVTGFLRGTGPEGCCGNGEEICDIYSNTYGSPANGQGYSTCSKVMMMLLPIMEAVRIGLSGHYTKDIV